LPTRSIKIQHSKKWGDENETRYGKAFSQFDTEREIEKSGNPAA
jgi:hypothetical protein